MRELKVVGLDVDGKRIICETDDSGEKFILLRDDRLRAAVRGERTGPSQTHIRCRDSKRAASQGDSSQDSRGRFRRAGRRRRPGSTFRPGREVCPSGVAGALTRRRAGNRSASGARRRTLGADAVGDGDGRADRPWPRPRRHQLGRLAQRGRPLDGAVGLESGQVGHRRISGSPPARTAAPSPRSTTRHAS